MAGETKRICASRMVWQAAAVAPVQAIGTHRELLGVVQQSTHASPCWIGLDAPVLIRNPSGTREADSVAHELFSREHAGCYPVNLGLPFAAGVLQFVDRLRQAFLASRFAGKVPLFAERAFLLRMEGFAVSGRIDAVFGESIEARWEIVDWKTGKRPAAEDGSP